MRTHSIFYDKKVHNTINVSAKRKLQAPLATTNNAVSSGNVKAAASLQAPKTAIVASPVYSEVANTSSQSLLNRALLPKKLFAATTAHTLALADINEVFADINDISVINSIFKQSLFLPKDIFASDFNYYGKSKTGTNRVSIVFTSREVENVDIAISLFQKYVANLANRLLNSTYLSLDCVTSLQQKSRGLFRRSKFIIVPPASLQQKVVREEEKQLPLANKFEQQKPRINLKNLLFPYRDENKGFNYRNHIIKYKLQVGVLKAVRNLSQKRLTSIPQKAQLYTVIRSPHVFKKTREQFATQQYKRVIKLDFTSVTALRLLTDTVVLLKLPVEIKVIIHT
jgi:ribosomal protein S10